MSLVVVALVLPPCKGGASTRTNLEVRTSQVRGAHDLQCVQTCLNAQQRKALRRLPRSELMTVAWWS